VKPSTTKRFESNSGFCEGRLTFHALSGQVAVPPE
jgi:hypothetical protein